jgi:hypothetical protein
MAHRCLGNKQLVGCAGKAQMARRGFKGFERI